MPPALSSIIVFFLSWIIFIKTNHLFLKTFFLVPSVLPSFFYWSHLIISIIPPELLALVRSFVLLFQWTCCPTWIISRIWHNLSLHTPWNTVHLELRDHTLLASFITASFSVCGHFSACHLSPDDPIECHDFNTICMLMVLKFSSPDIISELHSGILS